LRCQKFFFSFFLFCFDCLLVIQDFHPPPLSSFIVSSFREVSVGWQGWPQSRHCRFRNGPFHTEDKAGSYVGWFGASLLTWWREKKNQSNLNF
jgi:hypothetical protein